MLARDGRELEVVNRDNHYSPHFQVETLPPPRASPRNSPLLSCLCLKEQGLQRYIWGLEHRLLVLIPSPPPKTHTWSP